MVNLNQHLKNAPIIHTGLVEIHFGTGALWKDFPIPIDIDTRASSYKYLELWLGEIVDRWPATRIALVIRQDDDPPEVNTSLHSASKAILRDIARLGLGIHNRPQEWMVQRDTVEALLYAKRYPREQDATAAVDDGSDATDDSGPETGDP